jgi:mycothiol synthase
VPGPQTQENSVEAPLGCRPVRQEEVHSALRLVFSSRGRPADDAQVMEFLHYADSRGISTRDIWVAERAGRVVSAVLPVYSPGHTALLLPPGDMPGGDDARAVPLVVDAVCTAALIRGTHLAQVLLDPVDSSAAALYGGLGFKRMAELLYLQTSVRRRAPIPPLPPGFQWVGYFPATHSLFATAITESYQDSLDCPGLNGLRDIEDVIAGHKASGEFDPGLWFLLNETVSGANGTARTVPRAVLVLSRLPRTDAVELVYLGLTPEARGRGLGAMVLRHALGTVARIERARLTLAVDSANVPALKLYYRQGMQQVASKVAMMRDLRVGAM